MRTNFKPAPDLGASSSFYPIPAKLVDGSSQKFQYLHIHQLHTLCAKKVRTYDRSAENDVRVASCLTDSDVKLDLISLHEMTQNIDDYHVAFSDFQNFEHFKNIKI